MTEPIMAYCSWALSADAKALITTGIGNFRWAPLRPVAAQCRKDGSSIYDPIRGILTEALELHEAPSFACTCGYYAMKDIAHVPKGSVYGRVALWGHVVECEFGYRAQYAYPQVLFAEPGITDEGKQRLKTVAAQYGAEIASMPEVLVEAIKPKPQEGMSPDTYYALLTQMMTQSMGSQGNSAKMLQSMGQHVHISPWIPGPIIRVEDPNPVPSAKKCREIFWPLHWLAAVFNLLEFSGWPWKRCECGHIRAGHYHNTNCLAQEPGDGPFCGCRHFEVNRG